MIINITSNAPTLTVKLNIQVTKKTFGKPIFLNLRYIWVLKRFAISVFYHPKFLPNSVSFTYITNRVNLVYKDLNITVVLFYFPFLYVSCIVFLLI